MAYDASILAEALELYIAGNSAAKIAGELKRGHPTTCARVCEKSVLKWITKPDAFGKTWLELKIEAQTKAQGKIVEQSADRLGQLNGILDDVIEKLTLGAAAAEKIGADNPLWGLQLLFQYVGARRATLKDVPVGGQISGEHVRLLFEVIQADPDLGPVFERRQADLLKTYQEKCRAAGLEK